MLNGKVIANAHVREYVGFAWGSDIRTAGGAAMYDALAAIVPSTVEPPIESPAQCPRKTPSVP